MLKISIIIPVYNAEKYLKRCIDSIIKQTYSDYEVILVNDGSSDDSGSICDEYAIKDSRIHVFHKHNGGTSSARNYGLKQAKGEWISFIDADDTVNIDFLETFAETGFKADMLSQGFFSPNWRNDTAKHVTIDAGDYPVSKYIEKEQSDNILGFIWCKLFKSSIIKQNTIYFNEEYKLMEDLEFISRYLPYCKNIIHSSAFGYNYIYSESGKKFGNQNFLKIYYSIYNELKSCKGDFFYYEFLKNHFFNAYTSYLILNYEGYSKSIKYLELYMSDFALILNKRNNNINIKILQKTFFIRHIINLIISINIVRFIRKIMHK